MGLFWWCYSSSWGLRGEVEGVGGGRQTGTEQEEEEEEEEAGQGCPCLGPAPRPFGVRHSIAVAPAGLVRCLRVVVVGVVVVAFEKPWRPE